MKALVAALAVLASSPAFASMNLTTVQYDSETLKYSYSTGGGCEDHEAVVSAPKIEVKQQQGYKTASITIAIDDKTKSGRPDLCRAIVFVEGKIDMYEFVTRELKAKGVDVQAEPIQMKVQLPAVTVTM